MFAYIGQHRMLEAGDYVILGVSGGADSVCLLFLMQEYRKQVPFSMGVVHVNHGIRPDAGQDAAYVRKLCENLKIPFFLEEADVESIAKVEKLSEEEAGRKVRYDAFMKYGRRLSSERQENPCREGRASFKIALAHHMGDRAETMLFHLFRGSGMKGLSGIRPCRRLEEGEVIRPLLCLTREEIEEYLAEAGVSYCQDSTNTGDSYARNRIRHHILPYAEKEICGNVIWHINRAAQELLEAEDYLTHQTAEALSACVKKEADCPAEKGFRISVSEFNGYHTFLQKRMLLELLNELSPGKKDIGAVHVDAFLGLFCGQTGKSLNLPFGIRAWREYDTVYAKRSPKKEEKKMVSGAVAVVSKEVLDTGRISELELGEYRFRFQVISNKKNNIIPEKIYTKWFDYDKIKGALSMRPRQKGDILMIRGGGGAMIRKTVKEYMINEKIPRALREELVLLAEGNQVLWIPGYRISEAYKVDGTTERILSVELFR